MNVCKHQGLYKHKDISNGECHSFSYFNFENIKTTNHSSTKICYLSKGQTQTKYSEGQEEIKTTQKFSNL